eukprot:m.25732 g.25732  ORF g.25732 m.25732 type:complete len:425 (-) comp9202_c0_seq1:167-1441(-)
MEEEMEEDDDEEGDYSDDINEGKHESESEEGDEEDDEEEVMEMGGFEEPSSMFLDPSLAGKFMDGDDEEDTTNNDGVTMNPDEDFEDQNEEDMRRIRKLRPDVKRQTYVFSATLMMDQGRTKKKKGTRKRTADDSIQRVMSMCGLRQKYFTVNLLKHQVQVTSKLIERRITCNANEKDAYLYYFIRKHQGRTLVFVNSIDAIRRLLNLFRLLDVQPLGLFAQMQQRQRLKNLDRFKQNENSVMFATDVAARGLDIKGIEHVIHYQLPRSTDTYIHRSGRTARAHRSGLSVILQGPEDMRAYKRIVNDLNKRKELEFYPVDVQFMKPIRQRIKLAAKVEKLERLRSKTTRENDWFRKAAEDADMELDDHMLKHVDERKEQQRNQQLKSLRAELKHSLKQPIVSVLATNSEGYVSRGKTTAKDWTL